MTDDKTFAHQATLEEFKALRAEMLWALNSRVWGVASYAIMSGAILAFASKNEGSTWFLGPILLGGPFALYTAYAERIRVRIHTYIECVLEEIEPGLRWERSMLRWRSKEAPDSSIVKAFDRFRYLFSLLGVYDIVAAFAFYTVIASDAPIWHPIVGGLGLGIIVYGHLHLYQVLNSKDRYKKLWGKALKDLGQSA